MDAVLHEERLDRGRKRVHAIPGPVGELPDDNPAKLPYDEIDHFVRCLDSLSIGAITALGTAWSIVRAFSPSFQGGPTLNLAFEQLSEKLSPRMDPELVMGLIRELNSFFLLSLQEPGIRTPGFGNYQLGLTRLGQRFVTFVEGGMPQ